MCFTVTKMVVMMMVVVKIKMKMVTCPHQSF